MRDIADRLKILIAERLGVDEATVTPDASFIDDLGADSLDLVDLMTSLEEEFGLELTETEMEGIHTVKDAADYIGLKRGS